LLSVKLDVRDAAGTSYIVEELSNASTKLPRLSHPEFLTLVTTNSAKKSSIFP
jgi:hypothetical protein